MIAALYVEPDGAYYGVPGVDPWDEKRDARKYAGPHPVVAHPPCQRWGRFWHGSTRKPHQFKLGDDNGCFAAALESLERFGGVLEHPCDSHAWAAFGLSRPPRSGGWVPAGRPGMWTCCVYQGHYGHMAGKPTWLLAKAPREALPELRWGKGEQRLHPVALAKHGYAKARRIGMLSMIGGKDKTRIRNTTPPEFRAVLLEIARAAVKTPQPGDALGRCFDCMWAGKLSCTHGVQVQRADDEAYRQHQRDRIAEAQQHDAEQAKPKLTDGVDLPDGSQP